MKTCSIDATAIENACSSLDGIAGILVNLAEVAEAGATEIGHASLFFLAEQVREQRRRIDGATASAWAPPNVAQMPRQAAAN